MHHQLLGMARRTKVVSKQEKMVDPFLKIWHHLTNSVVFAAYLAIFLYLSLREHVRIYFCCKFGQYIPK